MYWSLYQRNPERSHAIDKSEVSGDLPTACSLRFQISLPRQICRLCSLVQCPVKWCSMVLVLSHKWSILGHSLRSYLWYRTSSFTKNVPHKLHHCLGTDGETCFLCHAGTIEVTIFPGHFQAMLFMSPLYKSLEKPVTLLGTPARRCTYGLLSE